MPSSAAAEEPERRLAIRAKDVPNDLADVGLHRGDYALDESGKYTVVPTSGWEVERSANEVALRAIDRDVAQVWQLARSGHRSSLAYHLTARMFTVGTLAEAAGVSMLRVWWHLRPGPFARVPASVLERYAQAMKVAAGELRALPSAPARLVEDHD